jgi:AcrR family transcriptional regulator
MDAHDRASKVPMTRTYTLKKRAEQQAETRRRIVEAAVDLHSSVGPAATTFSMIAEKAGVQRHTLYAHFPDERSIAMACSGSVQERDPPPDAATWRDIADCRERLTAGLSAIYAWYARNASLMACVMRDAEHHALTREIIELRFGPSAKVWHEVLGAKLSARQQRAMLHLALSFFTWRSLVRESGLKQGAAVKAMVQAIECANEA